MTISASKGACEKRPRLKANVARKNIITAARELFAEKGYARTTTRDIASRACSSEVLLFRYFQSKANLFREALVEPFDSLLKSHLEADGRSCGPGPDPFEGSEDFIEKLFQIVNEHRDIFFALISTRLYEAGAAEEQVSAGGFKEYFRLAVSRIEAELNMLGVTPTVSPDISSRISFVSVVASALFYDWIFADKNFDRENVIAALNKFIISGTAGHGDLDRASDKTDSACSPTDTRLRAPRRK